MNKKEKISVNQKIEITEKFELLLDEKIRPHAIKTNVANLKHNYIADVYIKWRGNSVYLCAKFNSPGSNAISPSFESKHARISMINKDKFTLSYMRYNNSWFELYSEISIEECFDAIEKESYFALF